MKRIHYFMLIILIAAFAYNSHSIFEKPATKKVEEIHYHAGFEIYKDGARIEFTDLGYMDVKPCGSEDDEDKPDKHLEPEVHLHDGIGNIVHIHGKVALWKDLFKKLNIEIASASIEAYLDETPQSLLLDQPIKPYQQAVFFINSPGNHSQQISESLSRMPISYIKDVEKKGENCTK